MIIGWLDWCDRDEIWTETRSQGEKDDGEDGLQTHERTGVGEFVMRETCFVDKDGTERGTAEEE